MTQLTAITGAAKSHDHRDEEVNVNVRVSDALIAAIESEIDRLVLASSCDVNGNAYAENLDETADPRPVNPHAKAALADPPIEPVSLRIDTNLGWNPGVRFILVVLYCVFRPPHYESLTA